MASGTRTDPLAHGSLRLTTPASLGRGASGVAQAAPVPPAGAASGRGSRPAGRARPQEGAPQSAPTGRSGGSGAMR